jgi:hypothetical protein
MIRSGALEGPEVERFQREARAAARLHHPHIVPIYGVGWLDGRPCYTMPLAGGSLAQQRGRFVQDPRAAAALLEKVARAVHHAHQRGVIHRDLKPGNILLDEDGEPLVSDFGLAKLLDASAPPTRSGAVLGTPAYMAPEQAAGRGATAASDVWSLGVILFELAAGSRPTAEGPEPPRLRALRPDLPPELETVTRRCLERRPEDRYASAAALADDLGRWLAGRPIEATPPPWNRRASRLLAGAGARLALGALLLAVGAFLVGAAFWMGPASPGGAGRPPDEPPEKAEARRRRLALEEQQRRLDDGLPATLVDPDGRVRWYRWATQRDRAALAPSSAGCLRLQSYEDACLLELLPGLRRERFTLSAKVQIDHLGPAGRVGLYWWGEETPDEVGRVHRFASLHLAETNRGADGLGALALVHYQEPHPQRESGAEPLLVFSKLPRPELFQPHQLTVQVAPEELKGFWDDKPIGVVSRRRLDLTLRAWEPALKPGAGPPPRPPDFHGRVGLFLVNAQARFRDVVLTPEPDR